MMWYIPTNLTRFSFLKEQWIIDTKQCQIVEVFWITSAEEVSLYLPHISTPRHQVCQTQFVSWRPDSNVIGTWDKILRICIPTVLLDWQMSQYYKSTKYDFYFTSISHCNCVHSLHALNSPARISQNIIDNWQSLKLSKCTNTGRAFGCSLIKIDDFTMGRRGWDYTIEMNKYNIGVYLLLQM